MKKNAFTLQIPEPCNEKWSGMHPTKGGRFCDSCERVIVDFAKMSDADLIRYVQHHKEKICGRFRKDQLDKPMQLSIPRSSFQRTSLNVLFSGLLTMAGAQITNAQSFRPDTQQVMEDRQVEGKVAVFHNGASITGIVTDARFGDALIGANVLLSGSGIGTVTDIDGQFSLEVPDDLNLEGRHLKVSYAGYDPQEVEIHRQESNTPLVIKLVEHSERHGAAVVVGYFVPAVEGPAICGTASGKEEIKADTLNAPVTIHGTIYDDYGESLIGATIWLKGTTSGSITDFDGKFSLEIPPAQLNTDITLVISYTGYATREEHISQQELAGKKEYTLATDPMYLETEIMGIIAYSPYRETIARSVRNWLHERKARRQERKEARRLAKQARKVQKAIAASQPVRVEEPIELQEAATNTSIPALKNTIVFPSPFADKLSIELESTKNIPLKLELLNPNGQAIWEGTQIPNVGHNQITLSPDPALLSDGIFYLRLVDDQGRTQTHTVLRMTN